MELQYNTRSPVGVGDAGVKRSTWRWGAWFFVLTHCQRRLPWNAWEYTYGVYLASFPAEPAVIAAAALSLLPGRGRWATMTTLRTPAGPLS